MSADCEKYHCNIESGQDYFSELLIGSHHPPSTAQSSPHLWGQKPVKKPPKLHGGGKIITVWDKI